MDAVELIRQYTRHQYAILTESGNKAIEIAIQVCREKTGREIVLTVDQGGWLHFVKFPKKFGLKVEFIKTDYGIIDGKNINGEGACCLIYENPGGYFAEEPIRKVYENSKVPVILDVTGCIGDTEMCDGRYADILVGSFGEWKAVNLGYGGFVSFKDEKDFVLAHKYIGKGFEEGRLEELETKLREAPTRLRKLYDECKKIKGELNAYEIIHKDKKCIVVVVAYKNDDEKKSLINYCERNKYEFTLCPRYIRVNEKAISIEVKRNELA